MISYTLKDMRIEVQDNCEIEGEKAPSSERTTRLLNRAKDEVVAQMESMREGGYFNFRKSYTVAAGDASITLPDGSDSNYPAIRRILGLTRTDMSYDDECIIHPVWDRENYDAQWSTSQVPALYREGYLLYFTTRGGALEPMTLLLRYAARVNDLSNADLAAKFAMIPDEWADLVTMYATILALPASSGGGAKYRDLWKARLMTMQEAVTQTQAARPTTIPAFERY